MPEPLDHADVLVAQPETLWRVGVVVHPRRNIDAPLRTVMAWTAANGVELVQLPVEGQHRQVAQPGVAADCDLIVSIGGDGTTLAAIRAASLVQRPVLGVACGSLGALTVVAPDGVIGALERFSRQDWIPRRLRALTIERAGQSPLFAINDVAIVRAGEGQVRVTAHVDDVLAYRLAGDGCIVASPVGSSAYTLAAGGPLLAPGVDGFTLVPLPTHGGSCPPLVLAGGSRLQIDAIPGHGGARLEIDGQMAAPEVQSMTITLHPNIATLVGFENQEPLLAGLRRRQIITDSPRILADDEREGR